MRGFKGFILICLVLNFVQCKKDTTKEEPALSILENGKYYLQLENGGWHNYYIMNDKLFNNYRDSICFEREAGRLTWYGDSLVIPYLHVENSGSLSPCDFENDIFQGDTFIFHFSGIYMFTDNYQKIGLKGRYSITMPSGLPFSKYDGYFILGFKPKQN